MSEESYEALPLPSPLPLLRLPFSTFSAPHFDRNTFAAGASPALLYNIAPLASVSPSPSLGKTEDSEHSAAWLTQIPFSTFIASFLGQHATVSFEHPFWRCSDPLKTALAQVLGPDVWGPGDFVVQQNSSTSLEYSHIFGGNAFRQGIGMDCESDWLHFGVTEPRLAVFRSPKIQRKTPMAPGGDEQKQSIIAGLSLLNTMSTTPFTSVEYFLLLNGGPVDWTAAAGASDDQGLRKNMHSAQHLNITGYTAEDLRRLNCRVCTFRQHVGEIVVVPPRCFVQAVIVNTDDQHQQQQQQQQQQQSGPVLMLSWLSHNPATLEIATNEEVEMLRKEARPLPINYHKLVYRALEKRVSELEGKTLTGPHPLLADIGVLLRCMSKKLTNETICMADVERITAVRPPEVLLTPEVDCQLVCGRCKTIIFGRYYRCSRCEDAVSSGSSQFSLSSSSLTPSRSATQLSQVATGSVQIQPTTTVTTATPNLSSSGRSESTNSVEKCKSAPNSARSSPVMKGYSGPIFCLECVVEGLRCDHLRDYRLCEVFPQEKYRRLVERAVALFDKLGSAGMGEMIVGSVNTGQLSYATVAHALVSMALDEQRATCHQCKLAKPRFKVMLCTNTRSLTSKNKPRACCKKYCFSCLWNRYSIKQGDCLRQRNWCCPFCENRCNCSACLRKKKVDPTTFTILGIPDLSSSLVPPQSHAPAGKKSPVPEIIGFDARPQKYARMHDSSPRARHSVAQTSETQQQCYLARLGPFSPEFLARSLTPAEQATINWADAPDDVVPVFFLEDRIIYYVHKTDLRPLSGTTIAVTL